MSKQFYMHACQHPVFCFLKLCSREQGGGVSHSSFTSLLATDHVTLLSKKFVDWLRYASITQGGVASSVGFFTGPRSRQVGNLLFYSAGKSHSFIFKANIRKSEVNDKVYKVYLCICVFSVSRHP